MINVKVRNVVFGEGMPKICVPLVGTTQEEILSQLEDIVAAKPDCIELRIDWFEHVDVVDEVLSLVREVRNQIGDIALLFTFRSSLEGGEKPISVDDYKYLYETVCVDGNIDILDVEAFREPGLCEQMVEVAHNNDIVVIGSNHDFEKTPECDEIINRLKKMDDMGVDIPKIALMPVSERDVLNVLSATLAYYENGGNKPIVTMSMKQMGLVSRLCGELTGSAMTFATVKEASAPGQIDIAKVRQMLQTLHGER